MNIKVIIHITEQEIGFYFNMKKNKIQYGNDRLIPKRYREIIENTLKYYNDGDVQYEWFRKNRYYYINYYDNDKVIFPKPETATGQNEIRDFFHLMSFVQTDLIPLGKLPINGSSTWWSSDHIDNAKHHPYYTKDSFKYYGNDLGWRGDNMLDFTKDTINIGFFGCSMTFASGVPIEDSWPKVFCERLSKKLGKEVKCWIIANPGHGNSHWVRVFHKYSKFLRFDFAIFNWTDLYRKHAFTKELEEIHYMSNFFHMMEEHWKGYKKGKSKLTFVKSMLNLETKSNAILEFMDLYNSVINVCKYNDILYSSYSYNAGFGEGKQGFSWWQELLNIRKDEKLEDLSQFTYYEEEQRLKKAGDIARDMGHPGPEMNKLQAKSLYEQLNDRGIIDEIQRRTN